MTFIRADLIREGTSTRGTGNITTNGATVGSRPFSSVCSVGDTFAYSLFGFDILGNPTGEFETGIGTYVGVNTIARTTVQASSHGGSNVSFTSPQVQIAMVLTAEDVNGLAQSIASLTQSDGAKASLTQLASSVGSSLVGYQHAAGADATNLQTALRAELHNVNLYFIAGETDAKPMFQRAMAAQKRVWVPAGTYQFNSSLPIPTGCILDGDGDATVLSFNVAGDGLTSIYPVNGSTAANVTVYSLKVQCTNGANAGGGFAQTCASYIYLSKVTFTGWKYGVIFDQTEISGIYKCQFISNTMAGIWLVNGSERSPGASSFYTNRITIADNQFNLCPVGIIDDGGVSHSIRDNNFNGGQLAIYMAGTNSATISNNELEYQTTACVKFASATYTAGAGVGNVYQPDIRANYFIAATNAPAVICNSALQIPTFVNNVFYAQGGVSTSAAISGFNTVAAPFLLNNRYNGFTALVDAYSAPYFQWDSTAQQSSYFTFQSASAGSSSLSTFAPSNAAGTSPLGGTDFKALNSASATVTYARIGPSAGSNAAGAEEGGLAVSLLHAGVPTVYYSLNTGWFGPILDNYVHCGQASHRWDVVYAGTGAIATSDEREKQQIQPIDAAALRAWARVEYCQFKFNDAVATKGNGARWHFGVIAQRVKEAFEAEGLDAFAYGVLCYDEWPDQPEVRDEEGVLVTPAVKGGNRYGVRYEEALALECAYLRSRLPAA